MPSIDYEGRFHGRGVCTDKYSTGALGFPIKASTLKVARRFASRVILDLLPGWNVGSVVITKDGNHVASYTLCREEAI